MPVKANHQNFGSLQNLPFTVNLALVMDRTQQLFSKQFLVNHMEMKKIFMFTMFVHSKRRVLAISFSDLISMNQTEYCITLHVSSGKTKWSQDPVEDN